MMRKRKNIEHTKLLLKKGHKLYAYFNELCLNSNNLYNATNFYIRQVYTALKQEKEFQPLQKEIMVLVQKFQDNCNESLNLGHTDTITLKKVCDRYGKTKFVQMEALSA